MENRPHSGAVQAMGGAAYCLTTPSGRRIFRDGQADERSGQGPRKIRRMLVGREMMGGDGVKTRVPRLALMPVRLTLAAQACSIANRGTELCLAKRRGYAASWPAPAPVGEASVWRITPRRSSTYGMGGCLDRELPILGPALNDKLTAAVMVQAKRRDADAVTRFRRTEPVWLTPCARCNAP